MSVELLDLAQKARKNYEKVVYDGQGHSKHTSSLESLRSVVHEYNSNFPPACQNCGHKGDKWRKDGFSKLFLKRGGGGASEFFCMPVYVRKILGLLWDKEEAMLRWLVPGSRDLGPEMFFLEALLVPPNRFRPLTKSQGGAGLSFGPQSTHLSVILVANENMHKALRAPSEKPEQVVDGEAEDQTSVAQAFRSLQDSVNSFMDSAKGEKQQKLATDGIRQMLEKKQGLFRQNMMGKRVNFAARSVISPDPNLETGDVGIPMLIAKELSYPEVAAAHNAKMLRQLVVRGVEYPGANEVHEPKPNGGKKIWNLQYVDAEKREALANRLITDLESGNPPMTVFRHLVDGDPLLVNRQPTLHKPGIMAHTAKVLKFEKTVRLHYANCKTYNADFDGDEMNLHAPQDPIGRIEALAIARADRQFLVPTDGSPLRGLIQDHVIAGVMISKRDTYFSRAEVCNLLYIGMRSAIEGDLNRKFNNTDRKTLSVTAHLQRVRLRLDPPIIQRPKQAWCGKQLFTMLLKNILAFSCKKRPSLETAIGRGSKGLSLDSKSKTPGDIWNGKLDSNKEESTVMFRNSELLMGVLDKNHFGASAFSLTHLLFELVGSSTAGQMLSSLCRLLTAYLQMRGFTCAMVDLILKDATEIERSDLIRGGRKTAKETIEAWLARHEVVAHSEGNVVSMADLSRAGRRLLDSDEKSAEVLESMLLGQMQQSWTNTIDACIPIGQRLAFPKNCFASMVQTGAKGSKVNHSQISCLLGQQELEGRQVPLLTTWRSLPCFAPYDLAVRTRGYITDRFLSGIRPQEYFFHCMAGREGLIDTAVKTSRSGYLQRCLVKHLEGLRVAYDYTVRDSDGSVVQFLYGEDGVDVTRASHLTKFNILHDNFHVLEAAHDAGMAHLHEPSSSVDVDCASLYRAASTAAMGGDIDKAVKLIEKFKTEALSPSVKHSLKAARKKLKYHGEALDPVASVLDPAHYYGSTSEVHENKLIDYVAESGLKGEEAEKFMKHMRLKFMQCLAEPGEAVGVLAAQSMGEPSTQMTLNTFHLAGHGGANVTLGIPRLREIIQTASKNMSTPTVNMKVLQDDTGSSSLVDRRRFANKLAVRFRRVNLTDILQRVVVQERTKFKNGSVVQSYHCSFRFWPLEELCRQIPYLTPDVLKQFMSSTFARRLKFEVTKFANIARISGTKALKSVRGGEEGDEVAMDPQDEQGDDAAMPPLKKARLSKADEEQAVEEEEPKHIGDDADNEVGEEESDVASGMYSSDEDVAADVDETVPADQDAIKEPKDIDDEEQSEDEKPKKDAIKTDKAMKSAEKETAQNVDDDLEEEAAANTSGTTIGVGALQNDTFNMTVSLTFAECAQKLMISEIVDGICAKAELQDPVAAGVKRVHVIEDKNEVTLNFEGTNLAALHMLPDGVVDHSHISTNDIHKVFCTYGVEAARANIVREIKNVFGHYGIAVDHRHLSLVADHMTMDGKIRPFNRTGMLHSTSPMLQMSYETTMQFLSSACQDRVVDTCASPASAISMGKTPTVGTGMVSVMMDLTAKAPTAKERTFTW